MRGKVRKRGNINLEKKKKHRRTGQDPPVFDSFGYDKITNDKGTSGAMMEHPRAFEAGALSEKLPDGHSLVATPNYYIKNYESAT